MLEFHWVSSSETQWNKGETVRKDTKSKCERLGNPETAGTSSHAYPKPYTPYISPPRLFRNSWFEKPPYLGLRLDLGLLFASVCFFCTALFHSLFWWSPLASGFGVLGLGPHILSMRSAFGSCQGLQKGQHEDQGHIQAEPWRASRAFGFKIVIHFSALAFKHAKRCA